MTTDITSLDHVFNNSKSYEDIQERRAQNFADIERALEIVREFIVRKKRVLYGGMSIDISLRLSDHPGIYADNAVPDYDFYSPDIEGDSNEIAEILQKAGFHDVFAHNAVHATTRRVKINMVNNVADISYMPDSIYKDIPTQTYKGMRVTHPIFQWMDIHRALSQPFEKPPWEVIAHRVHKDIKRYRLMYEEYGIPYDKELAKRYNVGAKCDEHIEVDAKQLSGVMLGGYQAYAIMLTALISVVSEGSLFYKPLQEVGILTSINDLIGKCAAAKYELNESTMAFSFPNKVSNLHKLVNVISDDFIQFSEAHSDAKSHCEHYNMYGDVLRPRTITVSDAKFKWEVFDNLGRKQPCFDMSETSKHLHTINKSFPKFPENAGMLLSGPQNVLLYALQKYHDYNTPESEKPYHLYMYQSGIWIIEAAEKVVNTLRNTSGVDQKGLLDLYKILPFFLTTRLYGRENWSADYLSLMYYKIYLLRGTPNAEQQKTRPQHYYYPGKSAAEDVAFDVTSSPIFQMDGAKVKGPFTPTSMDPDKM
jgi:hypothetical protein